MLEILQLPFMQRAFLIGAIAAIPFGLVGTFVVVRRIGYLTGAIAHCAFGGIGIGLFLQSVLASSVLAPWFSPMTVSLAISVASALLIGEVRLRVREREDTIIGAIWVVGMGLGVLLLELTPGNVNIGNFLFGNILLITREDVYLVASLALLILVLFFFFFRRIEAVCFDEEFARLRNVSTRFYFQLLLAMAAVSIVLLVRIVGILLVIAMLTLPAATASRFAKRLPHICVWSILICFISTWLGLLASVLANTATGPTIGLTAALFYLISLPLGKKN